MSAPHPSRRRGRLLTAAALLALATGCSKDPCDVVLYTNLHQIYAERAVKTFTAATGLRVCPTYPSFETKATGVLGQLLDRAEQPPADVFWSDDPVRPWALVRRGIVVPYVSPEAASLPEAYRDPTGIWAGAGAQVRLLLVNTKLVAENARPKSVRDLAARRWKGRTAIANPRHGTTLVHFAALASRWGEEETQRFLSDLDEDDVQIASTSWEVKQLVESGKAAFGLTNNDHVFEAVQAGSPVAAVVPDQESGGLGALVLPTSVMLIRGPHPENGRRLVDHLLSRDVEAQLVNSGGYLPLRDDAVAAEGMPDVRRIRTLSYDPAQANDALERMRPWLDRWHGK